MELVRYLKVLRKSWWIIALLVISAVAAALGFSLQEPARYESNSTLLLNPGVPNEMILYYQSTAASNLADSYTALIHSRTFAESVAKELPYPSSPEAVIGSITTQLQSNTLFYQISGQADTAQHAQQLVDTVNKVFLSANADQRKQQEAQSKGGQQAAAVQQLKDQIDKLNSQITRYTDRINQLEAQTPTTELDTQLSPLYDRLSSLEQTRTTALAALATLVTGTSDTASAVVLDPPTPGQQLSRKIGWNVLAAGVVALVLGIGIAFLREYLDYTVRAPEYLEELLGLPPLAAIGEIDGTLHRSYSRRSRRGKGESTLTSADGKLLAGKNLITLEYPHAVESEVFRVLRTSIQFAGIGKPIHTLAVTSAGPGEGKSFTAANLAIVMAQAGKRVVLVDTDLRRPTVHKIFGLPNTVGFTSMVLNPDVDRRAAIQPIPAVPGLFAITSGPLPPNPSEVLSAQQTIELMHYLTNFDVVIYDAPPAGAVTDPMILGTRVDAVILVVSAGVTRKDMLIRVKKGLQTVGVRTILPVLNRVKLQDMQGSNYYYYYHMYTTDPDIPKTNGHHPMGPTDASDDMPLLRKHPDAQTKPR